MWLLSICRGEQQYRRRIDVSIEHGCKVDFYYYSYTTGVIALLYL